MNTTTTPSIFSASTYHRYTNLATFVASAAMTWGGVDTQDAVIALVGALILVLSSFGLFFNRPGKPARQGASASLHNLFHEKRGTVALFVFIAASVTFWHAIDVKAVLPAVATMPVLIATFFDMLKARAKA